MSLDTLTFEELCDELSKVEETQLLELLDLRSDDIVSRFRDVIEDNYDVLLAEVSDLRDLGIDDDEDY